MKDNNEVIVEDGDLRMGDSLGIQAIALEQYRRCCLEGSKEMVRGGWTTKIIKGVPIKVEAENQREVFMNSVIVMRGIMMPDILKEKYKEYSEDLKKIDNHIDKTKEAYEKRNNEMNQEMQSKERLRQTKGRTNWEEIDNQLQGWFETTMTSYFREMFVVLSRLLAEENYYEEAGAFGGG